MAGIGGADPLADKHAIFFSSLSVLALACTSISFENCAVPAGRGWHVPGNLDILLGSAASITSKASHGGGIDLPNCVPPKSKLVSLGTLKRNNLSGSQRQSQMKVS